MQFNEKIALLGWLRKTKPRTYEDALNEMFVRHSNKQLKGLYNIIGGDIEGKEAIVNLQKALKDAPIQLKGHFTQIDV